MNEIIYVTDGTRDGIFSALYRAYEKKVFPDAVIGADGVYASTFGAEFVEVPTVPKNAERVRSFLYKYGGSKVFYDVAAVLRSGEDGKETAVFNYLKYMTDCKRDVSEQFNEPCVLLFYDMRNRVMFEAHRMNGFLRFSQTESGVYYACYEPDNDVTPYVARHFQKRLAKEAFVIHDGRRNVFAFYANGELRIVRTDEKPTVLLSEDENMLRALWKKYFSSVNIPERQHLKQQRGYLPVRYRRNMLEFDPDYN